MESSHRSLDVNVLVEQVAPLRRLARRLVWQEADADDLVQDAALAALQSGARAQQPAAWLRGVVRLLALKRWNTTSRHERLDRAIPAHEAPPEPHQVMETLELQKRLATILMELGEPYRTAIHMRYFQDRPPREIAAALDLPLHTVKTHLSRGMERLRQRLDADHSGSRRAWQVALAPLAGIRPEAVAAAGTVGGLLGTSVAAKSALVAATLLVVAVGSWLVVGKSIFPERGTDGSPSTADADLDASEDTESARLRGRASGHAAAGSGSPDEHAASAPTREDAAAGAPEEGGAEAQAATSVTVVVVGQVRDATGVPQANALVEVHQNPYYGRRAPTRLVHGISDARGTVRLSVAMNTKDDASRHVVVTAQHGEFLSETREITLRQDAKHDIELRLHEALTLTVQVQDANEQPLPGAVCTACYTSMIGFREPSGDPISGRTDETGAVRLLIPDLRAEGRFSLGGSAGFRIRASRPGFVDAYSAPIRTESARQQSVTIQAAPAREIAVRVLSDDDEPLVRDGFQLTLRHAAPDGMQPVGPSRGIHTDAAGGFRLERAPLGPLVLELRGSGFAKVTARIEPGDTELIVRMHRLFRATFLLTDQQTKTPLTAQFAFVTTRPEGLPLPYAVEGTLPGRVDVSGLAPGKYTLRVRIAGRWGVHTHRFVMKATNRGAEAVSVPTPRGRTVDIQVREADGSPIADVLCHLGVASKIALTRDPPFPASSCVRVQTDSAGRARAQGVPTGSYMLHTRCPDDRTIVLPVTVEEPDGDPISLDVRFESGATLRLPTPEEYPSAGVDFRPQVVASDGTRHFPTTPESAERPILRLQGLPAGSVTAIPDTSDFETRPFASDPYAVALELAPGEVSIPTWPALHPVRARLVVRDADGSPLQDTWFALLRVGPGVGEETVMRHRYLSRKIFLLGDEGVHVARGLLPGHYYLVVMGKGFRAHHFEVADQGEQTILIPQ